MDKVENRVLLTPNQTVLLKHMCGFRNRGTDPTDKVVLDRRRVKITSEDDRLAGSACLDDSDRHDEQPPESLADGAAEGEASVEQEMIEGLLYDVPPEMLAAAVQILKGQMKTKTEARTNLDMVKRPDGVKVLMTTPEDFAEISDIVEDARPLPLEEPESSSYQEAELVFAGF